MRIFFAFFFAALLAATPAWSAPPVDDAGAALLKKEVDDTLAVYLQVAKMTGAGFAVGGDVIVAPKGNFYQVKIPGAAFVYPEARLDIGNIVLNVSPGENGEYLASAAMPSKMTLRPAGAGKAAADITLGEQKFAGVWQTSFHKFTKIDALYKNIRMKVTAPEAFDVSIGTVKAVQNLEKDANNLWSGPSGAEISDVLVSVEGKNPAKMRLNRLAGNTVVDKRDMAAAAALEEKIRALSNTTDPEGIKALMSTLAENSESFHDGASSKFTVSGLSIEELPQAADSGEKPFQFSLSQLGWAGEAKGLRQDKGAVSLQIMLDGLSVPMVEKDVAGLIPTDGNIELRFDNFPVKEISKTLLGFASTAMDASFSAEKAGGAGERLALQQKAKTQMTLSGMSAVEALRRAGFTFSIRNTRVAAPDLLSTLDGKYTVETAATGLPAATGGMLLELTGIDELVERLQKPGASPKLARMAGGLSVVQMMGQPEKAADGRSLRRYKFELADGKMLLNGADIGGMTGMFQSVTPGKMPVTPPAMEQKAP